MKKLILLLLSSLILTACPAEQSETGTSTETETQTQTETAPSDVSSEAPVSTETVSGDAIAGKQVFLSKTCTACHKVSGVPEAVGVIGPALDNIGNTAATRVAGEDAVTYLKQSIEHPEAHLAEGFQNLMTPNLKASMSDTEYNDLIAYLVSLKS